MVLGRRLVGSFLSSQLGSSGSIRVPEEPAADEPTSIFYTNRLDYGMILRLMPDAGSVVESAFAHEKFTRGTSKQHLVIATTRGVV